MHHFIWSTEKSIFWVEHYSQKLIQGFVRLLSHWVDVSLAATDRIICLLDICVKATPHGTLVCIKDLCEELLNSVLSTYMCINYFCYGGKNTLWTVPEGVLWVAVFKCSVIFINPFHYNQKEDTVLCNLCEVLIVLFQDSVMSMSHVCVLGDSTKLVCSSECAL